jgi:hypothetical protein
VRFHWVIAALAASCVLAGCLHLDPVTCPDGRVCPHNSQCDVANNRCISNEQVAACAGHGEGDMCRADGAPGYCRSGVCEVSYCGNGVKEGLEECDGADLDGKTCDDVPGSYGGTGLQCSQFCTFDATPCSGGRCGDGMVNGPELCDGTVPAHVSCLDYGFDVGTVGCTAACTPDLSGCGYLGWFEVSVAPPGVTRIWASSRRDIYAGGVVNSQGIAYHFDGSVWTPLVLPATLEVTAIAGTAAFDAHVFALGASGVSFDVRCAGTSCSSSSLPVPSTIAGASVVGNEIFAVGSDGWIMHFDGTAWTSKFSGVDVYLNWVWARSASDVWAVGAAPSSTAPPTALRFDGVTWSSVVVPGAIAGSSLQYVTGQGASDVFMSDTLHIFHWDGSSWQSGAPGFDPQGLSGSPSVVFATSNQGDLAVWVEAPDRASWLPAWTHDMAGPREIAGDTVGHRWLVDMFHVVFEYAGSSWNAVPTQGTAIWGSDATDVFYSDCSFYDGGATWPAPSTPCNAHAIWGASAANVYAVGSAGVIVHYDGMTWTSSTSGTADLFGVWGTTSASDIYAVGASGVVLHDDGTGWQVASTPSVPDELDGVWGSDASHVFVVGANGRLLHRVGTQWTADTLGGGVHLLAVWGAAADQVWAVGELGTILHYDGSMWNAMASGTQVTLRAVWGTGSNDVFAAGEQGVLLHFDGAHWTKLRLPTLNRFSTITSIWGDGRRVYFGGLEFVLDRTSYPPGGCASSETSCNDGIDDDCDMLVDCNDPDCKGNPACP